VEIAILQVFNRDRKFSYKETLLQIEIDWH